MTLDEIAWRIARKAFSGKVDKGGAPYIGHMERILTFLYPSVGGASEKPDEELASIAILHDLIEDCPEWNLELLSSIFPERVIVGIDALTRRKAETYDEYIQRLSENEDAIRIKLCDLKDNMNITRLKEITDKDTHRLNKYLSAWNFLNEKCNHPFKTNM